MVRRTATQMGGRADAARGVADDPAEDGGLVAFDFDGTLTVRDSFMAFLRWRAGAGRYALGMIRLTPAALAYLVHRDRGRLKAAAVREFLRGVPRGRLEGEARTFAEVMAPRLLRPDAVEVWRRWRARHARTVIVTASPDILVAPFARGLGADELLGTRLDFDALDRLTGALDGANCRGREKVRRLEAVFGTGLRLSAAYGDTAGDREMLGIADEAGYRVFKARP